MSAPTNHEDYRLQHLPEGLTLDSFFRIGPIEATVRWFMQQGMIRQTASGFIKVSDSRSAATAPTPPKPNPFSLLALQRKGFKVMSGNTEAGDLVMILPGSYCRITDAIRNGLLTEATQPI